MPGSDPIPYGASGHPRLPRGPALRKGLAIGAIVAAGIAAAALRKRSSGGRRAPVPDDAASTAAGLRQIDQDIWVLEDVTSYGFMRLPIRMTIIRLSSGDLLLHSPTPYSAQMARAVEMLGPVRFMIAPNTVHWMHMAGWQLAYPDAEVWAVEGLRERAQVQRAGLRIDAQLGDVAPDAWCGDLVLGVVPGGRKFRECFVFHKPTGTLVLCDLIENLDPRSLQIGLGLLARALGATRVRTAVHVRAILLLEARGARKAIERMVSLRPSRLIVAHGGLIEREVAAHLQGAFGWLL